MRTRLERLWARRPWLVLVAFVVAHVGLSLGMEDHGSGLRIAGLVVCLLAVVAAFAGVAVIARTRAIGKRRFLWLALFAVFGVGYVVFSRGHAPQLALGALLVAGSLFAVIIRRA